MNQAPDVLAIRLSKEFKRIHESAIQALVPFRRNSEGDPEWIVEHVYVRGANGSLGKLARVPGIDFIRKETAEPEWIEQLIRHEEQAALCDTVLEQGSFVRVLTGPCARLCGTIAAMRAQDVTVGIDMRTKRVKVHTHLSNLQLIHCPEDQRTFFYSPALFS